MSECYYEVEFYNFRVIYALTTTINKKYSLTINKLRAVQINLPEFEVVGVMLWHDVVLFSLSTINAKKSIFAF